MLTLTDICTITRGQLLNAKSDGDNIINSYSIDSRTLKPGALFVALQGDNHDGHNYITAAHTSGAKAILVQTPIENPPLPCILVNDSSVALQALAQHMRQQNPIPLIAITGSCGKTTTRAFVQSILELAGPTLASVKSYNNNIGVPLTLLQLKPEHKYAVLELGANHPGEIAQLTHIAHPDVAVITNAAPAHLEGFESLEGVACAKAEIFQGLTNNGCAVINNDDQFATFWEKRAGKHNKTYFSLQGEADVYATNITSNSAGMPNFQMHTKQGSSEITLNLLGEHNIANALAAAACCLQLNIPLATVTQGLMSAAGEQHRMQQHTGSNNSLIIDDTYNANPQSVAAAIDFLAHKHAQTILVLGDMAELGDNSLSMHQKIGQQAHNHGIHSLFTLGELAEHSSQAFGDNGLHFTDKQLLIDHLQNICNQDSIILIKGSRSMQMEQIVAALINKE